MVYEGQYLNTVGEVFNKALEIAKYTPSNAKDFLDKYTRHIESVEGITYGEALDRAKSNLGYFAGYYDKHTCDLIYDVYCTEHPIFGKNPFDVSPEDAFKAGLEAGRHY